jgi:HSP20 family protein
MARTNSDDMLMEEELAELFQSSGPETSTIVDSSDKSALDVEPSDGGDDGWDNTDDFPGQLAVDVYETADKLVVKARTAGISKSDLNVTISDNILTISGILSGGEDENTTAWHIQECYWGEFSRTIALPVQVKEEEGTVKAELKDGVLTITFEKEKVEAPIKIAIQ